MIKPPLLTKAQLNELEQYSWPGNVRELQNVIERATILAAHGEFTLNLGRSGRQVPAPGPVEFVPLNLAISLSDLKSNEKELVAAALKETRGKIYGANGAAAMLGLKPTTLASKLARLGLKRKEFMHG